MDMRKKYEKNRRRNIYLGIGQTISTSIGLPVKQFEAHYPVNFVMHPTQKTEIELIVRNLKMKCTEDFNGLSTKLLQATIHEITTPLEHILNQPTVMGTIPEFENCQSRARFQIR